MQNLRRKNESGRSMVEMLGVLAIAGVLSVGGVYGYGVAMKKHKANELLHQASMLATTISAQAMINNGTLPSTITSFGNSSYGTFDQSVTDALGGKGFTIKISNMDSAVCTQIEKMAGGMVRGVTCDKATGDATITYYKNLATTEAEGEKSPTGGQTCELTADDCASGALVAGECACAPAEEGATCTSHTTNQCGLGYYCQFSPSNCSASGDGVCTKITGGDDSSGHWVGPMLDWWSANSWCIGKGSTGSITYSTLQSAYGCDKSGYSCNWSALRADGLSAYYWSAEDDGNSCRAWGVVVSSNGFDSDPRDNASGYYALCE